MRRCRAIRGKILKRELRKTLLGKQRTPGQLSDRRKPATPFGSRRISTQILAVAAAAEAAAAVRRH